MSIHIKSIELCNWFQFKGPYKENRFEFQEGLNIIVGNNNAGKTKLHNAFRFMLSDLVRLEKINRKDENDSLYEEYPIDENTISKVFNQRMGMELKDGTTATLGVRLTYELRKSEFEYTTFLLEKSMKVKKEVNDIVLHETSAPKVFRIDRRTKQPRTAGDKFSDVVAKIIPRDFRNFFFIESEQKGIMIPLKGDKLKNTINSIVKLDFLDKIEKDTKLYSKYFENLKSDIEENESKDDKERLKLLKRRKEIVIQNGELEESILMIAEQIKTNEDLATEFKRKAEKSNENNKLILQLERLKGNIDNKESQIEDNIRSLIKSYFNKSIFSLRKLNEEKSRLNSLDNLLDSTSSMISERRLELDSRLSKQEQSWIYALEKSQPKPEIIERMVHDGKCFVCSQDLKKDAVTYMEEKLIPFFKNILDEDEELDNLESIQNVINSLKITLNSSISKDLDFFDDQEKKIINSVADKRAAETAKDEFLDMYGELADLETDDVSFVTYDRAKDKLIELRTEIKVLTSELKANNLYIKTVDKSPSDNPKSKKLGEAEDLSAFMKDISSTIIEIKRNEYNEFASELSKKITQRYQNFMVNNKVSKNNTVEVLVDQDLKGKYNFEIKVKDKFGSFKSEAGGADSGLRRVAVVFGLLDIAPTKKGYPFIADAPVSALSPEAKKDFFVTLLNDEALKQCIIMSMDLWDSKSNKINQLGKEIQDVLMNRGSNRMMTIVNKNDAEVQIETL